jgi:hypothetical protein
MAGNLSREEVLMAQHGYVPEYDEEMSSDRDREHGSRDREFMFGDEERFGRGRSDHPDAHYLDWRDRHMRELDRDYEEYRRERGQQFHDDFTAWRDRKHGNAQPLRTGMTQSGLNNEPTGTLELSNESAGESIPADPMAAATLGTTSGGRGNR